MSLMDSLSPESRAKVAEILAKQTSGKTLGESLGDAATLAVVGGLALVAWQLYSRRRT
jgi:hypothetical protein